MCASKRICIMWTGKGLRDLMYDYGGRGEYIMENSNGN